MFDDDYHPNERESNFRPEQTPEQRAMSQALALFSDHLAAADKIAHDDKTMSPPAVIYCVLMAGKLQGRLMRQALCRLRTATLADTRAAAIIDRVIKAGQEGVRLIERNNKAVLTWVQSFNGDYARQIDKTAYAESERLGWSPRIVPARVTPRKVGRNGRGA